MDDWRTSDGDLDPQLIGHDIETLGKAWADLTHAAALLEKTKDSVLARLVLQGMEDGATRSKAELQARASDEWLDHTYAILDARHKANLAKVHYEAAQARLDAMRTAEATKRAEMQTLGRR